MQTIEPLRFILIKVNPENTLKIRGVLTSCIFETIFLHLFIVCIHVYTPMHASTPKGVQRVTCLCIYVHVHACTHEEHKDNFCVHVYAPILHVAWRSTGNNLISCVCMYMSMCVCAPLRIDYGCVRGFPQCLHAPLKSTRGN